MALKFNGSSIGKVNSLPHHPLWRVHLSARTAAHDATAAVAIAYTTTITITTTTTTITTTTTNPRQGR